MSLSDAKIRSIKSSDKPFKLTDSQGLYLLVNPGGSHLWYIKYRFNRKESCIASGAYPLVLLSDVRQQRDGIRNLLTQNINPAQQRVAEKAAASPEKCFEAVAVAWHKTNKKWSADYAECILASMKNHTCPAIGHIPVTLLKTQHFRALLKVIEDKGFLEVVSRTRQQLCNIMRYAVQQGLTENNPALHLEGVTAPSVKNHYPALPLTLHLFIRSSELRFARWSEIDFRHKIWTIPAIREISEIIEKVYFSGRGAKMRTPHIMPLSRR